jgi:hypothetical protein
MRAVTLLSIAAVSAGAVFAQNTVQIERGVTKAIAGVRGAAIGGMVYSSQVVKNQPYSAEEITEETQTLADGTHINQKSSHNIYRDSEGRIRRENGDDVTISDPVAGTSYAINTKSQTARKLPFASGGDFFFKTVGGPGGVPGGLPAGGKAVAIQQRIFTTGVPPPPPPAPGVGSGAPPRDVLFINGIQINNSSSSEDLGTQSMEGVAAQGTRTTLTIPQGAIGNDRPINTVDERWFSPELQILLLTRHSDPRDGEMTFRLTNVRRTPPDPSLFQVPVGYQVVGLDKE